MLCYSSSHRSLSLTVIRGQKEKVASSHLITAPIRCRWGWSNQMHQLLLDTDRRQQLDIKTASITERWTETVRSLRIYRGGAAIASYQWWFFIFNLHFGSYRDFCLEFKCSVRAVCSYRSDFVLPADFSDCQHSATGIILPCLLRKEPQRWTRKYLRLVHFKPIVLKLMGNGTSRCFNAISLVIVICSIDIMKPSFTQLSWVFSLRTNSLESSPFWETTSGWFWSSYRVDGEVWIMLDKSPILAISSLSSWITADSVSYTHLTLPTILRV